MDKEKYHRSYPAYSYGSYRYGHRDHARIQEGNPCRRTPDRIGWHRSDDRHHQHPDILPSRQSRHDAQRRSPKLQSVVGSVSLGERYSKTSHHHSVSLKEITSDTKQGRPELREPLITTRTREQTKSSASQNHKESPGTDVNKNVIVGRYSAGIQGLHEEIEAFYAEIHADGKEATRRQTVIQRITQIITAEFPGVKVDYFGSTLTGLFLHSSDIDLVAVVNILVDPAAWLRGCYLALQRHSEVRCTEQLTSAKVPVVKFVDVSTGIKVDLSCIPLYGYNQGVAKSQWIKSTISRYPLLPKLVIVVKEYLRRRNLHEIYHRGINSYMAKSLILTNTP
ncbi:terminal nucleotidyltransferase 4A-like isoform X2 [Paramacrobiotus metropolitanus]|uniref:terminal nucleotidyltransferase 4A-like isoform X2 n=1 Tax=Paramacrobiotus metropolitanus TaxID=2943436 RepID=UPI00244589CE|nr:terminal nucleotidyltransferase 4A-like isoform X2 [Paramacrobiotus metropolitanus]